MRSVSLLGMTADLLARRRLVAGAGGIATTGGPAGFARTRALKVSSGQIVLLGPDAILRRQLGAIYGPLLMTVEAEAMLAEVVAEEMVISVVAESIGLSLALED